MSEYKCFQCGEVLEDSPCGDCPRSQSEVNCMFMQFHTADEQELSYVEEYEGLTVESSGEWYDRWAPTLNEEEIERIAWSLSDMMDGNDWHENIDRILDVLRPHVTKFKAYLKGEWGWESGSHDTNLGYESASDLDLEESQWQPNREGGRKR